MFHSFWRTIWLYVIALLSGIPGLLIMLDLEMGMSILIAIIVFLIIWGISFLISRMQLNNLEYKFYNNKVEYIDGFLIKDKKSIRYSMITNTEQWQGIAERIFSLEHIFIDTASSGGFAAAFSGWKNHALAMKFLDKNGELYEKINQIIHDGSK